LQENKAVQEYGYGKLYGMIKGNYFRGKKYIESFVTELEKRGKK
jgi:ribosomal protein L19E